MTRPGVLPHPTEEEAAALFKPRQFVINFGRYQEFFEATPGSWFPLLDCITALFTQSFFTHRAFLLNGRNWFLVIIPFLITRLVRLTLEAQIPATMSAIIYLGAFLVKNTSPVSIAIVYFQSKLYVIGLLYSLNVREALQGMGSQIHDTSSRDDFWSPPVTTIHVPVDEGTASVAAVP
ncbi:hypothetical protein CspHIS471_0704090 [Cutaneotrichosporon sp. HIS471]|nr:hypothetical protein CspHIS471_0704090 [Cutaneotrichosporon sp. HIS471]